MTTVNNPRQSARSHVALMLEVCALFVVLLVVAMRPLISETYESYMPSFIAVAGDEGMLTPATTAWFDVAVWLAAGAVSLAMVLRRERWRLTGVEVGWLLMWVGAIVSTCIASNKRLAINASCDWLTAGVMTLVLVNVCRSRLRVALLLSVIVASGLTSAARSAMQVTIEHAETVQQYESMKDEFWAQQNIALDDSHVILHERRLYANEASGFLAFSNVQGALLSLSGFAALGLIALSGASLAVRRGVLGVAVAALFAAILMTGSNGAIIAAVLGLLLWGVMQFKDDALRQRWRRVAIALGAVVVLGCMAVIGHGLTHGTLPGASLTFRWNYWSVAREIIAESPLTGVGALNFDRAYMQHKPIDYPEEIKDPHNFIVAIASQWGALGVMGLAVLAFGGAFVATRSWGGNSDRLITQQPPTAGDRYPRGWLVATAVGFIALRVVMLQSYLATAAGQSFVMLDLVIYGGVWIVTFATVLSLAMSGGATSGRFMTPVAIGVLVFLLHNMIGFALFVPATLYPFAAMLALLWIGRGARTVRPQWAMGLASVGLVAVLWLVLVPVTLADGRLADAREAPSKVSFDRAIEADRFDPVPAFEAASAVIGIERDRLKAADLALGYLDVAEERDRLWINIPRRRMVVCGFRYAVSGEVVDLYAALAAAERAVELYPASPDDRVGWADVLARLADVEQEVTSAEQALKQYEMALELNSARPGENELRRWSDRQMGQVRAGAERMRGLIHQLAGRAGSEQ